jgi:hypothetical protein
MDARRKRLRRTLAHQCAECHRLWALELVDHPAGFVARCQYCHTVRAADTRLARPISS